MINRVENFTVNPSSTYMASLGPVASLKCFNQNIVPLFSIILYSTIFIILSHFISETTVSQTVV